MFRTSNSVKAKRFVVLAYCLAVSFFLVQPEAASGSMWNRTWTNGKPMKPAQVMKDVTNFEPLGQVESSESEDVLPILAASSTNPKRFWVECASLTPISTSSDGQEEACVGSLWYVDPLAAAPTPTLFDNGILVTDEVRNGVVSFEDYSLVTGTIDFSTYHMSNLQNGYIYYFKGGKIFLVDTRTLTKTQLSNETGVTPNKVCESRSEMDWQSPLSSMIGYHLKGNDNICNNGDDQWKAVKLNTPATSNPFTFNGVYIDQFLFDGKRLVQDWTTQKGIVKICDQNLANCVNVDSFENEFWTEGFDRNLVVYVADGKLKRYSLSTRVLKTLYTPPVQENVGDIRLDKDGTVYFVAKNNTLSGSNKIKKATVSAGGVVTVNTLASINNSASNFVSHLRINLSSTRVMYRYISPTGTILGETVMSVLKAGGTPITLSTANVNGGMVGEYLYTEDPSGKVTKVNLNGTGKVTRANAQLNGATLGGSGDWYYQFDTSTFKGVISDIDNKVWAVGYSANLSSQPPGTLLGTLPPNLSNLELFDVGTEMLAFAGRRGIDYSFGRDVMLTRTGATNALLRRLTNRNGRKMVFGGNIN